MRKFEKECRLANLNILAERLHAEGRSADAYTIRKVLSMFKDFYPSKRAEEARTSDS